MLCATVWAYEMPLVHRRLGYGQDVTAKHLIHPCRRFICDGRWGREMRSNEGKMFLAMTARQSAPCGVAVRALASEIEAPTRIHAERPRCAMTDRAVKKAFDEMDPVLVFR